MEGKAHSQKHRQNVKAEDFVPDEGTRETPEKQLSEVEMCNIPENEFRTMIVKMIQDLGKRMEAKIEKMQEMFNKDLEELKNKHLEELKNKQTEMNNTITEMKTALEGISSRKTEAEEWISDLEDRMVEFTATEQNKEKRIKRNEIGRAHV